MSELRFDNRVVIVTGAGAGLGRTYALLFGSRGAKVVVNDLGGTRHGEGVSTKAADVVVDEIRRNGGIAVADYNSVVEGEKVVKTALDNFGRVDIIVNNAGILRDRSIPRISEQDWNLIHDVHLKGSFKVTQAAFPIFKQQNYGRVIMTSSNSGIYGNFGQANYAAAKMGLVGLTNTVAIEGKKYNIHCNAIVPTAASRLTEDVFPPDMFNEFDPKYIAPVVAYLCHESCEESGSMIESGAGWAGKLGIVRSDGVQIRARVGDDVTIEKVRDNWATITDMSTAKRLTGISEASGKIMASVETLREGGLPGDVFEYGDKEGILYALGVGASISRPQEVRFLYENHEEFQLLPTFMVLPGLQANINSGNLIRDAVPGKTVALERVLHGEQYLEVFQELPTEGTLISKPKIVEVLDKGSGAVIVTDVETYDENGTLLARNQISTFAVGSGNFGGPRTGTKAVPVVKRPDRKPDISVTEKTSVDQAALYRLSGDRNPLHIDVNMAALAGYKKAILHGLCTLGYSVRIVLGTFAGYDASLFKAVKARFMKPVIPGNTLRVDMWREGNRIFFETFALETNYHVVGGSYVDLKTVNMQPITNRLGSPNLKSDAIFEFIIDQVNADPQKAKSIGGVFLYVITKDKKPAKHWTMDLKNGKVYEGKPDGKPNTTLTVDDEDFLLLAEGKLNPQTAFMKGKLKVAGNIMMAQKLAPILQANRPKL